MLVGQFKVCEDPSRCEIRRDAKSGGLSFPFHEESGACELRAFEQQMSERVGLATMQAVG